MPRAWFTSPIRNRPTRDERWKPARNLRPVRGEMFIDCNDEHFLLRSEERKLLKFLSEPPALAGGYRHSTQQGTTDPPANAGGSDKKHPPLLRTEKVFYLASLLYPLPFLPFPFGVQ